MVEKNTHLLTNDGEVTAHNLKGTEKLARWSSGQKLVYEQPRSFQFFKDNSRVITISTQNHSLTTSSTAPVLASCSKTGENFFDLMLLENPGKGAALGIVNNFTTMIKQGIFRYQKHHTPNLNDPLHQDHLAQSSEKYFILERYSDRETAKFNLHLLACKYGLPVTELSSGWQGIERTDLFDIFTEVDTLPSTERLKRDHGLFPDWIPHLHIRQLDSFAISRSHYLELILFESTGGHVLNIYHLASSKELPRGILSPVVTDQKEFTSVSQAIDYISHYFSGSHVHTLYSMKIENHHFTIVPARWLKPGMEIPVIEKGKLRKSPIKEIDNVESSPLLYRILNKEQPTLVANNILIPSDIEDWWKP